MRRHFLAACAVLLLAPLAAAAADSSPRFDVAYAWRVDLATAQQKKKAVGALLGPRVRRKLRVVQAAGAYAVLYLRHVDAHAAGVTAAAHTRLLARHGQDKAVPIPSARWVEMVETGEEPVASAAPAPAKAPAPAVAKAPRAPKARKAPVRAEPRQEPPDEGEKIEEAADAEKRELQNLLVEHMQNLRKSGRLSRDERTAWSIYDFTTGEVLAEVNADAEFQAASLIKPFLALGYFHEVAAGRLQYDDEARRHMEKMIQVSDNASADWVMRKLGGPAATQKLLQANYGTILQGVDIQEYIPVSGRTYRNKASARDYSRFLLALWRDELPEAKEIKRLMGLPKRDRLRTGVPLPADTEVYGKTGSTSRLCGDMGVLQAKGPDGKLYAYTLIGLIEKGRPARHYFRWLRSRGNIIREISALVYQRVGAMHGFAAAP